MFPLILSLLLLDAVRRFQLINDLLLTVFVKHGRIFFQTTFLGYIFIYLYSVYGFWIMQEEFSGECETLWRCILYYVGPAYRAGGGVADLMQPLSYANNLYFYSRYIYEATFFLFIITILSAIISGIVIDAFNAIRDKLSDTIEDINNKCFICSQDSNIFDRHAEGFNKHITVEHNM